MTTLNRLFNSIFPIVVILAFVIGTGALIAVDNNVIDNMEVVVDETPVGVASVQSQAPTIAEDDNIIFTGLEFGGCDYTRYHVDENTQRSVKQCYPDKYTLYNRGTDAEGNTGVYVIPIETNYMGAEFNFDMQNIANATGFTRNAIQLAPGNYLLKVEGFVDVRWNERDRFGIGGFYQTPMVGGAYEFRNVGFETNGHFKAEWYFERETEAMLEFTVYVFSNHAILPEWSYITISNITLEKVDW